MKSLKFYLSTLLCFAIVATSFAQNKKAIKQQKKESRQLAMEAGNMFDESPQYKQWQTRYVLDAVEYTEDATIFHYRFNSPHSGIILYAPNEEFSWFLRDDATGQEYDLVAVKNFKSNGKLIQNQVDQKIEYWDYDVDNAVFTCEVHFERLPNSVKQVDLIEGRGREAHSRHFNCFDIQLMPRNEIAEEPIAILETIVEEAPVVVEEVVEVETPEAQEAEVSTSADLVTAAPTWKVYPNPSTSIVQLEQVEAQAAELQIYSVTGQLVWSGNTNEKVTTIDVSNFTSGNYVVSIHVDGELVSSKKLIIE